MLHTPLGELFLTLDGHPLECTPVPLPLDRSCAGLDGRYLLPVTLEPDGREHRLACRIRGYEPSEQDCIEGGENLELKSFYGRGAKLSLGMEGDTGVLNGRRLDSYDYDAEYLPDGVQYHLFSFTRTARYGFGAAWLEHCTPESELQTWLGADPAGCVPGAEPLAFADRLPDLTMDLCDLHSTAGCTMVRLPPVPCRREKALSLLRSSGLAPEDDRLLHLTINYHSSRLPPEEEWLSEQDDPEERAEQIVLDWVQGALICHFRREDESFSSRYTSRARVQRVLSRLSVLDFPRPQAEVPQDILPDQLFDPTYSITACYSLSGTRTVWGRLDRYGVPEGFDDVCRLLRSLWRGMGDCDLLERDLHERCPRRASDPRFCEVIFRKDAEQTYTYLCEDPEVREGDVVVVPVGRNNLERMARVQRVFTAPAEDPPYPLDRIKRVLRRGTDEEAERTEL